MCLILYRLDATWKRDAGQGACTLSEAKEREDGVTNSGRGDREESNIWHVNK